MSRAWIYGPLVALALVLALMQAVGLGTRRFVATQKVHVARTAAEGYAALRADGVRGRIVVLIDERSRVVPRTWMATFMESLSDSTTAPPVMLHNSISALAYSGIARAVYFVPPGGQFWTRELQRFVTRPDALTVGSGALLQFNTVPVILTKPDDLPIFSEKIVVWLFEPVAPGYTSEYLSHVTDPAIADVVVRMEGAQ
jgi:hypothetical protein